MADEDTGLQLREQQFGLKRTLNLTLRHPRPELTQGLGLETISDFTFQSPNPELRLLLQSHDSCPPGCRLRQSKVKTLPVLSRKG